MDLDEFLETLMKTERVPKYPQSMYFSEGVKYLKLFQYEKALEFLDEAVANYPKDIKSLLRRSKCHIALRDYTKAIDDANAVLKLYPNNVHAMDMKGQAQYLMGDFEGGYLTYSKGKDLRPSYETVRLGEQMCREAMDNSLNKRHRLKLDKNDATRIVESGEADRKFEKLLKNRRGARECFGKDVEFMEDLMRDKNLASVHNICKEAVDYIKYSERFWCMVDPLNLRRKRPKIKRKDIQQSRKVSKPERMCMAAKRRAECGLQKGRINDCITEARNLLIFADSLGKENQLEKIMMQCDAYHLLSLANIQGKNTFHAVRCLLQELEIANEFDLVLQQIRSYHKLGEIYQMGGNETKVLFYLNKVADAIRPEKIGNLLTDNASPTEVRQVDEARKWANSMASNLVSKIRYSVLEPIIDATIQNSKDISSKNGQVKEKSEENVNDSGTLESPESMPILVDAEESDILNTSSKMNISNQLKRFSHEGVLEQPLTFKDKETKQVHSEVKYQRPRPKLAKSIKKEVSDECDLIRILKGIRNLEELDPNDKSSEDELDADSESSEDELDTDDKSSEDKLAVNNKSSEDKLDVNDKTNENKLYVKNMLSEDKLDVSDKPREDKSDANDKLSEEKLGINDKSSEGKLDTNDKSVGDELDTNAISSEDELGVNNKSIEEELDINNKSIEDELDASDKSGKDKLDITDESSEDKLDANNKSSAGKLDTKDKSSEDELGANDKSSEKFMTKKRTGSEKMDLENVDRFNEEKIQESHYSDIDVKKKPSETKRVKDIEKSQHSVKDILDQLLDSLMEKPRYEQTALSPIKIVKDLDDSSKGGEINEISTKGTSEEQFEPKKGFVEETNTVGSEEIDNFTNSEDEMSKERYKKKSNTDLKNTPSKAKKVKDTEKLQHSVKEILEQLLDSVMEKPEDEQSTVSSIKMIKNLDGSDREGDINEIRTKRTSEEQFQSKKGLVNDVNTVGPEEKTSSGEEDIPEEIDYTSSEDEMPKERDKKKSNTDLKKEQSKTKKVKDTEKSQHLLKEILEQLLDSVMEKPDEQTTPSSIKMIKSLDDSKRGGEMNEIHTKRTSEEQFQTKKGFMNDISTVDPEEKTSSENEDIPEEIDNYSSSEDEMPKERDKNKSNTNLKNKPSETKKVKDTEKSQHSVKEILEQLLDSVMEKLREQTALSTVKIIKDLDDSNKANETNTKRTSSKEQFELKKGFMSNTSTVSPEEKTSSGEEDIPEEINNFSSSDEDMPKESDN